MDFDYFILDAGVLNMYTAKEFFKCDKQLLICSLSSWKKHCTIQKAEHLLNNTCANRKHVTVLENLSMKKSSLLSSFDLQQKVLSFPFIENPFLIDPKMFRVFDRILERN